MYAIELLMPPLGWQRMPARTDPNADLAFCCADDARQYAAIHVRAYRWRVVRLG